MLDNEIVQCVDLMRNITEPDVGELRVKFLKVNDARQREAMEAQIHHFGQTPSQVLKEPHPVRLPPEVGTSSGVSIFQRISLGVIFSACSLRKPLA